MLGLVRVAAWFRQLRSERLRIVGEPPASGQHEVRDPLRGGTLRVWVRGDRLTISSRLNPVWEWNVPVFVGRIERTGGRATIDGLIRPSWFGLFAATWPIVAPLWFVAVGRYVGGLVMFGVLAPLLWSQLFIGRDDAERARVDIVEFLEWSSATETDNT